MLNCYCYIEILKPFDRVQKISSGSFNNIITKMSLQMIYLMSMYKQDVRNKITYNGRYAIRPNLEINEQRLDLLAKYILKI